LGQKDYEEFVCRVTASWPEWKKSFLVGGPIMTAEKMIRMAENLSEDQLYAGLTILSNGAVSTLHMHQIDRNDGEIFRTLTGELEWQRMVTWGWSPLWNPGSTSKELEDAIHNFVYDGENTDISLLLDPTIEHEWTKGPGKDLFDRFKEKFKDTICKGPDCPYTKMEKGLIGQADLPATIVATLVASGVAVSTFWIPILVYFALLLVKTGLKMYCEV